MSVDLDNPRPGCEDYHALLVSAYEQRGETRAALGRANARVIKLESEVRSMSDDKDRRNAQFNDITKERDEALRLAKQEQTDLARLGSRNVEAMRILGVEFGHPTEGLVEGAARVVKERDEARAAAEQFRTSMYALEERVAAYREDQEAFSESRDRLSTQLLAVIKERDEAHADVQLFASATPICAKSAEANRIAKIILQRDDLLDRVEKAERERDEVRAEDARQTPWIVELSQERDAARATVDRQALHITHLVMQLRSDDVSVLLEDSRQQRDAAIYERDEAWAELAKFDALARRCADVLADEVAVLVRAKVIDSRSPTADALLDYRNSPSTERADRMAELERELLSARSGQYGSDVDRRRLIGSNRTLIAELDAALARAEAAERERDAMVDAVIGAPQNVAIEAAVCERIAALLDKRADELNAQSRAYSQLSDQHRAVAAGVEGELRMEASRVRAWRDASKGGVSATDEGCPGPNCPACNGEHCDICVSARPGVKCEHDVVERHAGASKGGA